MAYRSELDDGRALLVACLSAGGDEMADFRAHVARMRRVCELARPLKKRAAVLVVLERGHALPDAATRKHVAEQTSDASFDPWLVVVTPNPMLRGVFTALGWLRKAHYESHVVSEPAQAFTWLERQRGEPLPELALMLERVLARRAP
ncbi:MAG: hypothetical protein K8H88_28340 [Sandaracinaceae bacterium]|nr:hypothetical protein [Sandaracinaceae bacterium]